MIDPGTLVTIGVGVAASVGGYIGGRKNSTVQADAVSAQASSIEALRIRMDLQQETIATIPGMQEEIRILRELVTQRANVDKVIEIVTRIEGKINEAPEQS